MAARVARLYSYCLPFDDGAAPNPYGGMCTLTICKPGIRSTAKEGDWIVGTGAKYARRGDGSTTSMAGRLIYAMKVTKKMCMAEYDAFTREHLADKIPDLASRDRRLHRGDSIYDYSSGSAVQRRGPHGPGNIATDLRGKNALLSGHFYYFGANAIELPEHLLAIAQNRQGHRVRLNAEYVVPFIDWIEGLGHSPCSLLGEPLMAAEDDVSARWCASCRADEDEEDEEVVAVTCR